MSRARAFAAFWWDFIVGDHWRLVAGLAVALALIALLAHGDVPSWWLASRGRLPPHGLAPSRNPHAALNQPAVAGRVLHFVDEGVPQTIP